jgi:translation initiation factor IF-2
VTPPKVRVHEISKVLGVSNAEVIDALAKQFKVQAKSHSSTVEQDVADKLIAAFKAGGSGKAPEKKAEPVEPAKVSKPEEKPAATAQAAKPAPEAAKPAPAAPAKVSEPTAAPKPAATTTPARPTTPWPSPQAPQYNQQRHAGTQQGGQYPPRNPQQAGGPGYRPGQPGQHRPGQPSGQFPPRGPHSGGARPGQPGQHRPGQPGGFGGPGQQRGQQQNRGSQQNRGPQQERISPRQKREEELAAQAALPKVCTIDEPLDVRQLAEKLRMRDTEVIKHLFMKGMMVTVNQTLDIDFAKGVAKELGFEVTETEVVKHEGEYTHLQEGSKKLDESQFQNLIGRSPVVSIMGHVDHGKTTLLDSIRETRHKVVDSEAGGITQSIGAYTVEKGDQTIVFLDTPGHEAFTAMRMRGAQATDIAILVVSADDGVMPQTIEAINHAKVAKIPIIVAVNKIDKADADPDRVLVQLAEYGLSAEKWGGDTLTVEVSALQKLGLDELLDSILLVSELLELKADATVAAEGVIIEAQLDKRMGPVATALVKNGTLKVGDNVIVGAVGGRVRALIDDHGARIQKAGPATPVEILGLDGVPNAGESFRIIRNDKQFKQELADEKRKERDQRIGVSRAVAAGFSGKSEIESDNAVKENQFNLLVKADTQGSLEAVVDVLQRMTSSEVKINIVHSATGDISEADVMLASTAKALIICFNTKADPNAQRLAEQENLNIKKYDVIYHITEDIEKWVLGQLEPETEEVQIGTAEVRQIFKVGKTGTIAGCMVTSGKLLRNAKANVIRAGKEVFSGPLNNLKRFKDDVKEVASGYECGISFDRFQDLQEGDIIEVYTVKSLERTSL